MEIVCFGNSRKHNQSCIGGKTKNGDWIRPIGASLDNVSECEQCLNETCLEGWCNGNYPKLLDIIEVPILSHKPHNHQTENYLIDSRKRWKKMGKLSADKIVDYLDSFNGQLWLDGHSSSKGKNDQVPPTSDINRSLYLLKPDSFVVQVIEQKLRGEFNLGEKIYNLAITDPEIEKLFRGYKNGPYEFPKKDIYLCISLGENFKGYHYKLIAGVIILDERYK